MPFKKQTNKQNPVEAGLEEDGHSWGTTERKDKDREAWRYFAAALNVGGWRGSKYGGK